MKAILPVAGAGTRLRPLTHTVPKVLVHVAGKPIMGHILDALVPLGVDEVVLVLGQFGDQIVDYVESNYDLKVDAVVQKERKGNGHAIYLTRDVVGDDPCLIVFGDTLFRADLQAMVSGNCTSIGVMRVPNPQNFGVVETQGMRVTGLVEKPENPTTDLAIVGIYYIRNTPLMFQCLDDIISSDIKAKGEYQLTSALECMMAKGEPITAFPVDEWLDCGSPENLLDSNRRLLEGMGTVSLCQSVVDCSVILVPPVAIGRGATIENSIIGPYVSVGDDVTIKDAIVRNGIVNNGAHVECVLLSDSLVGEHAVVTGTFNKLNIGDSSTITGVS